MTYGYFWHWRLFRTEAGGGIRIAVTDKGTTWFPALLAKSVGTLAVLSVLLPLAASAQAPAACKVNVNEASPAQLALLVQTGPVLAGKIAAARTAGPLTAETLDAVKGVGPAWLKYNEPHVSYSGPTTCTEKQKKPETLNAS